MRLVFLICFCFAGGTWLCIDPHKLYCISPFIFLHSVIADIFFDDNTLRCTSSVNHNTDVNQETTFEILTKNFIIYICWMMKYNFWSIKASHFPTPWGLSPPNPTFKIIMRSGRSDYPLARVKRSAEFEYDPIKAS